jgi:peptide/nickel transport system substrate-binding protein
MLTRRALIASTAAVEMLPSRLIAEASAADEGIRYGLGFDEVTSLDPHTAVLSSDIPILLYLPGLAERWESSPDKKQWTFFLRKGVQWHESCGEFSLDDAKFRVERVDGKGFTSPFRGTMINVDRVDTDGPSTLRVTLKEPDSYFLQLVVNYQAGYVACKKAAAAGVDLKTHPIGTGPFKFSSYQSRDKLIPARNDGWWAESLRSIS